MYCIPNSTTTTLFTNRCIQLLQHVRHPPCSTHYNLTCQLWDNPCNCHTLCPSIMEFHKLQFCLLIELNDHHSLLTFVLHLPFTCHCYSKNMCILCILSAVSCHSDILNWLSNYWFPRFHWNIMCTWIQHHQQNFTTYDSLNFVTASLNLQINNKNTIYSSCLSTAFTLSRWLSSP